MKFKRITLENFKSFQLPVTIDFPTSSNGKSIFLIGGQNGAGKTCIMEAIQYCLYGTKQQIIFNAINNKEKEKGNAFVSIDVTLETDDLEELIIKRSWSAGSIDDPKPKDLEEKLVIIKDGKRVSVINKAQWQDYINATVPQSITQFFFFDGEKIQEIADNDHSEIKLKSSLEAALGIGYLSRLANDIMYIKNEERKNYTDISDEDIDFKESELKKEEAKLKKKKAEKEDLTNELNSLQNEYDDTKKQFRAIFQSDPATIEEIKAREKKKLGVSNKVGQLDNQIKIIVEKYLPLALTGNLFKSFRDQINIERDISEKETIKRKAKELTDKIADALNNPFPISTVPLSEQSINSFKQRVISILDQSEIDAKSFLNLTERDAAKVLNKMEELEKSEVLLLKELLIEKDELKNELKRFEGMYIGPSTPSEHELFEQLQTKMESYQTQIGRITIQINSLEEDVISLENRISEIKLELEKLYDKHSISKEKKEFLAECDAIANLLNNFIVQLRKNKINLLQEKTFEMYKLLSSKSGLIKDLTINEKTYEITIKDIDGHLVRKSSLSAGEKEIFAVSLLWGLAQTSQLNLPIIIDTPLSRLDSIHRDNIVNNYFPNAAEQVIILSTDTEIDNNYYKALESNLSGAGKLQFNHITKLSTYQNGYFWN